ncbi:hypothetical protein Glove_511g3 [Diversispora epigaea]|uniref:Uncharacterized protein n=1 Tax=Diversispora epigaea TaxID=1348612 RepID=A0A397GJG1_9GLOM|nr:hypothetical protein Glove_511g3 [Diversispora epigaea]
MEKQLNLQFQEIPDEEIPDVNDEGNKNNNLKRKGNDMAKGFNKKPIEIDTKEMNTMQDKSSNKKTKKEVKDSQILKQLIKELSTNSCKCLKLIYIRKLFEV